VRSWDGLGLNVVRYGGEQDPPLLFLHGSYGHARLWDFVVSAIHPKIAAFALDLPGHGESGWAALRSRYALENVVRDIEAARASLGIVPLLIGHSYGSVLAMAYAADYGASLSGVVLIDIDPVAPDWQVAHLNETGSRPARLSATFDEVVQRAARMAPAADPRVWRHLAEHGYRWDPSGFRQKFDQEFLVGIREWDMRDQLRQIDVPTLVVRGAASEVMSVSGYEETVAVVPGATGVVVPGATHQVHLDQPDALATLIQDFLERLR
jgi:pimeloyl-ACP methyl ester carboxylesterase